MSTQTHGLTRTGLKLTELYKLYDIDILHENYSCTVDFGVEIKNGLRSQLEQKGFEVTHERGTIYTLTHEYQE